jgi:two-component system response regulator HydG
LSKRVFIACGTRYLPEKILDTGARMMYNLSTMMSAQEKKESTRILVIDDEPVIRDLLFDVLSRRGYTVDTAEDGAIGLKKATTEHYAVVFTDIRMPGMNGVEVYKKLKTISPKSRVIVMTGYGLEEMIQEALDLGAFADVKKPFDLELIYGLVQRAVAAADDDVAREGDS